MMRIKNKTGIMCIITSVVIAMSLLLCWNNYSGAADGSRTYWKYTYKGETYSPINFTYYELPAIPIVNNYLSREAFTYDERENAPLEQQIVCIKYNNIPTGTGFIIGDHEIMTAAHCVTEVDMTTNKPQITIPTANPSNGTDISLTPVSMTAPQDFYDEINGGDYAIVQVQEDLSAYGSVFLGLGTDEAIENTPVHLLGYAGSVMKISHGNITWSNEKEYASTTEMYGGTSGGPLYSQCRFGVPGSTNSTQKVQTYKTVVGIASHVTYCGDVFLGNYFVRITPEILQFAYDNEYL